MSKKVWDKDRFEKKNRCGDCGQPCMAFYCPECTQKRVTKEMSKGRQPVAIEVQSQAQKYGTDQDTAVKVRRDRTGTGQEVFVISYHGSDIIVTLRSAIDLVHKLQKALIDAMVDMMLVFVKGE